MPYENIPETNAPPIPAQAEAYGFTISLDGTLPDGSPRATVDDLDLFDAESKTGNKQMLDFLDRVVTKVTLRGETLVSRITVMDGDQGRIEERVEGVRGKGIAYPALKKIFEAVGAAMKDMNAGN
jgi:hypothetical protein